jgi:hypothetical protein
VGKRKRKQPEDDSIGSVNSESWIVTDQQPASLPSPAATTSSSESTTKRHCSEDSWTYFIADEQTAQPEFNEASEALQSIDMGNHRSSSVESEVEFYVPGGLQTPDLSPPNVTRYLSPAILESRPVSRNASISTDPSLIQRTASAASMARTTDLTQPEDEETVCIKLLAHLKKYSALINDHSRAFQIDLLTKSNASVRRILRSRSARADYSCQLLLSSILTHLTTVCEALCYTSSGQESTVLQDVPHAVQQDSDTRQKRNSEAFDMRTGLVYQSTPSETLRPLVLETSSLTVDVGSLLKRKPLDGFQTLGKWEMGILELGYRLQNALEAL